MRRRRQCLAAAVLGLLAWGLATPQLRPTTARPKTPEPAFLLGAVSFYSPRMMYLKYQPLVDYLSETSGHRWDLRINTSYQQTVDELCAGRLTAAYLGPLTYVRAHAACGAEPVLRLRTGGQDTYRSYIMVREDSEFRELTDLRGTRFGFGSVLSTSSHLVPRAMLIEAGLDVAKEMDCTYLEHHERAARAVLVGEVDACGIRDIVGERFVRRGLRVLARSRPIPNFPFVVGADAPAAVRQGLVRALVDLPREDPAIARRMSAWDAELAQGFDFAEDSEYDEIRELAESTFGPGALEISEERLRCPGSVR
jgi:phosphonate transport system substrate-binding protein